MPRLTLAQRIVAVIALGLLLVVVADFISNEAWQIGSGANGFFPAVPNGGAVVGQAMLYGIGSGLSGWVVLLVWLAAIGIWTAGSLFLFRAPWPLGPGEPDETEV